MTNKETLRADRGALVSVLRQAGVARFRGNRCCCPFHEDHRPSLAVVTHKGDAFYNCFSCGASGDCFRFVMDYHRMEFGEGSTATDMTKRTVVRKWRDTETGQWRATAEWKVYSSDPTEQIDHPGSMRIDTGRMEFRPVERDGRHYTGERGRAVARGWAQSVFNEIQGRD